MNRTFNIENFATPLQHDMVTGVDRYEWGLLRFDNNGWGVINDNNSITRFFTKDDAIEYIKSLHFRRKSDYKVAPKQCDKTLDLFL